MPKGVYLHKPLTEAQKIKIGVSVSKTNSHRKGRTYEQIFGIETAKAMREKQSLAKLGKSFKWGKEHPKGADHPRWIKDRTQVKRQLERGGQLHKFWSKAVKTRDGWKCKIANQDCSGKVVAHHILTWRDYPELRYELKNGITLCHAHHPRRRAEEKQLEPIFRALLQSEK